MDRALAILEELGAIDNAGILTALGKHIVSSVYSIFCTFSLIPTYLFYSQCCRWTSGLPKYIVPRPFSYLTSHLCQLQMLILATVFQCLGPIVTVAALLSSKPLFQSPLEKRDEAAAWVTNTQTHNLCLESDPFLLAHERASSRRIVIFWLMYPPSTNAWKCVPKANLRAW